jgi:hypothetical protein
MVGSASPLATSVPREAMKIGIVVGLGIGGTLLFGSAPNAAEANASVPVAAAPITLVPEAYTAFSVPVVPTASPPSPPVVSIASRPSAPVVPTASPSSAVAVAVQSPEVETRLIPPPAPAIAAESRVVPAPVAKFNPYHPHWVVDLH